MAETFAVEDCWELSISFLKSERFLTERRVGTVTWYRYGREDGSVSIAVDVDRLLVSLCYSVSIYSHEPESITCQIPLTESKPHFGGVRYWFYCPLSGCQSGKVAKLYLPPNGNYFGCRKCYGLQYRSSRRSGSLFGKLHSLFDRLDAGDDSAGDEAMEIMDRIGRR